MEFRLKRDAFMLGLSFLETLVPLRVYFFPIIGLSKSIYVSNIGPQQVIIVSYGTHSEKSTARLMLFYSTNYWHQF